MLYLLRTDIILINKTMTSNYGGRFVPEENLNNRDAFEYLIDAVGASIFGEPLYPNIWDKAGLYMYNIIDNHVFNDGNKRTGLFSAMLFLDKNGFSFKDGVSNDELINFTYSIGRAEKSLQEVCEWFRINITHYRHS